MSDHAKLSTLLSEIRPVYQDVQRLRTTWEELREVERAVAEYLRLLAAEERRLADLAQRKDQLAAYLDRLRLLDGNDEEEISFPAVGQSSPSRRTAGWRVIQARPGGPERRSPDRTRLTTQRRRLKQLVNRWAPAWDLATVVLAEINRVAEDDQRPLGEAIALLDWRIFEDPSLSGATEQAHLGRLAEWGAALTEYRDQLRTELHDLERRQDDFERRHDNPRLIWELWRRRDHDEQGRLGWQHRIDEGRQARRQEIRLLEADVTALHLEIARLGAGR
jgi:hypothetical protein